MDSIEREELISLIYEATLHQDGWRPFLDALHLWLCADASFIVFRHRPHGSLTLMARSGGWDQEGSWLRTFAEADASHSLDYDAMESGRIHALATPADKGRFTAFPFLAEDLNILSNRHVEVIAVGPANGFRAHFVWARDEARGPLGISEREALQSLMPHLERGMAIFARKILLQVSSGIGTEAMEQLAFGAAAIDKDCRILFCNRVADDVIARSDDLSRVDNRLIFRRRDHARTMRELATNLEIERVDAVLTVRSGDETVGVLARPIAPRAADNAVTTARVILYFHALTQHMQPSPSLLSKLFGLAPSEAQLAILLSEGATLREAAQQLGITENSVRTYSKRIFFKTGVRRQADLVRVILRSLAMLGYD
jgi:DNA-binding CsgD family transcriptional regulator